MRKIFLLCIYLCLGIPMLYSASYDNNEFQRKSRAYSALAARAYDEGNYEGSIKYSRLAEEYAQKSAEYIKYMLARSEAEQEMNRARTRYVWAKNNKAEIKQPEAFKNAGEALQSGDEAFKSDDFDAAIAFAKKVMEALADITEEPILPAQYVVRTWKGDRDCLWNIAKDKAVYDDPYLWYKLYEANKDKFPDPKNPHWVEPGIVIDIPSLWGEIRNGVYDPEADVALDSSVKKNESSL